MDSPESVEHQRVNLKVIGSVKITISLLSQNGIRKTEYADGFCIELADERFEQG